MQVKSQPKKIGYVWYYEKLNPCKGEKYISVNEWDKIYKEDGRRKNACKEIIIYDEREREVLFFDSRKEASEKTGLGITTITDAIKTTKEVLVKKRYRFKKYSHKRSLEWEYSNKNYG